MSSSGDWLPSRREEQLAMAKTWIAVLPSMKSMLKVTDAQISELGDLAEDAESALEQNRSAARGPVTAAKVRQTFADMIRFMRDIRRRHFFSPPMEDPDWVRLSLRPPDTIRTDHKVVTEEVEFVLLIRGIRVVHVDFWILGSGHKAKPHGYDGAVVVWDVLDAPPADPLVLNRHTMASRTPHIIEFPEEERGRTVYVALAWQNERGILGRYSDIKSTVIP